MLVVISILVALACIAASARRLWIAVSPTVLEPSDVVDALGKGSTLAELRALVDREPGADWERDLFDALAVREPEARAALVNEQLTELDLRMKQWERVPRVCASVATSVGILLGTMVLRRGLAASDELTEGFIWGVLNDAISVVSFGIVGTAFCIGAHTHARRVVRARLEAADRMVERLEGLAATAGE